MADRHLRDCERAWAAGGDPDVYDRVWARSGETRPSPPRADVYARLLALLDRRARTFVVLIPGEPNDPCEVHISLDDIARLHLGPGPHLGHHYDLDIDWISRRLTLTLAKRPDAWNDLRVTVWCGIVTHTERLLPPDIPFFP